MNRESLKALAKAAPRYLANSSLLEDKKTRDAILDKLPGYIGNILPEYKCDSTSIGNAYEYDNYLRSKIEEMAYAGIIKLDLERVGMWR